ncbi:paired immunoglobulin-like type 2 receptor alpha isoform X1 [Marmota marmota marmota]|uniref:Ig-like domain-containing protein n=1 Tax=Marmota marmota marmota TaxID=9994 RepID=A0A8C5ZF25_MARMA|nr:paired immunoglobulin-like type 2 receptor alpha isoform X1 [Marmota marmota marmota]
MGCILLLLLLLQLPIASLKAGYSEACSKGYHYEVTQPEHLKAPKGGSITISFSFCYSWVLAKNPDVRISWRRKEFHGPFFYNHTSSFTHEDYKNRLSLDWKKGQKFGSLIIQNLREEDESTYFCRIQLNTEEGIKQWQSIKGTTVTITHIAKTTMQIPISKTSKTTTGIEVTESKRRSGSQPLSLGAAVGVALAIAVFVTAILALMVFLRWKRKDQPTKAQSPASELFSNTEEQYENVEYRGHNIHLKMKPEEDNIVYASLSLSNLTLPGAAPSHTLQGGSPEKSLYSVLKT